MKEAAALSGPGSWVPRATRLALFSTALCGIAACSLPEPLPAVYVLGSMPRATATEAPQTGLLVVEVKRVQLPDYLDTTDIVERRGNQLVPSSTGRWGERLSVGMTRALTAALAARLPGTAVTAMPPVERPARQIQVDVAAFEARADHQLVLVVRWTIADGVSRQIFSAEQASLVEAIPGTGDGAVVETMSHVIEELADRIVASADADHPAGFLPSPNEKRPP
jgi:hypothetical protein